MSEYHVLYRLGGRRLRLVGERWAEPFAHHATIATVPDPAFPGCVIGARLIDHETGVYCDPLTPEEFHR